MMHSESWLEYATASQFPCIEAAGITLYPESHEVFIHRTNVHCSETHFHLLEKLLTDFCKTVAYEHLMETKGREVTPEERNLLNVQMCLLRRWLRAHCVHMEIRNVYARGYQARPASTNDREKIL